MYGLALVFIAGIVIYMYTQLKKKSKLKCHLKCRLKNIDINIYNNDDVNKEIEAISQSLKIPVSYIKNIYNGIVNDILDELICNAYDCGMTKECEQVIMKAVEVYNPPNKNKYTSIIRKMKNRDYTRYKKLRVIQNRR